MKIFNKVLVLVFLSQIAACASKPSSAYESGWTTNTNEDAYTNCAVFRLNKQIKDPAVLQHLVASGSLSKSQAQRALIQDVRVGDPECLAYAAYGLDRHKIAFYSNKKGQVTAKAVTYRCDQSEVVCPGLRVQFADGKVSGITPLNN